MEEVNLREASLKDMATLLELEQKLIEAERSYNSTIRSSNACYYDLNSLLADSNSHLIVAEHKSCIIGTGYAQIRQSKKSLKHDRHSYLGFMYIDPQYRGLGINRRFIEEFIKWSKTRGITDIYLDVYEENETAIRAYEKAGFVRSLVEMKLESLRL